MTFKIQAGFWDKWDGEGEPTGTVGWEDELNGARFATREEAEAALVGACERSGYDAKRFRIVEVKTPTPFREAVRAAEKALAEAEARAERARNGELSAEKGDEMNTNRIMKALRALMEAVSDGDGRSAQAQEVVDRAVWDLGVIYDFDFEEGGNVFAEEITEPLTQRLAGLEQQIRGMSLSPGEVPAIEDALREQFDKLVLAVRERSATPTGSAPGLWCASAKLTR